jgi:hypothetical protein
LLVAGNETLPEGSNKNNSNNWSVRKSRKFLQLYEADSDNEADVDDADMSRRYRLKVAKTLGITRAQLNFAQMDLLIPD